MFVRGLVGYLPANLVQGGVGLVSILAFTRLLSPEAYGFYALAFVVMTLAHTSLFTWVEAALARFWLARAEPRAQADLLTTAWSCAIAIGAVYGPIAIAAVLSPLAEAELRPALAAGLFAVLSRHALRLCQERRRAAGEVSAAALQDVAQTASGLVIGLVLAGAGLGAAAPLWGLGLGALIVLPFALGRERALARDGVFDPMILEKGLRYGAPIAASLLLTLALGAVDRFLIAGFLDAASVGAYHAAYSLANRTLDVAFVWLGAAGAPALVAALERGGASSLAVAARRQGTTLIMITLPMAVGLALVARPLAEVMVGEGLRDAAATVTPWIAAAAFLSGLTTYHLHQAFTLSHRTGRLAGAMLAPALANIGLNLVLIPRFGLEGAAMAIAASYAVGACASYALGRTGSAPMPLPLAEAGRCALAAGLMATVVLALPAPGGLAELILKAGLGALAYGAAIWALDVMGVRALGPRGVRRAILGPAT